MELSEVLLVHVGNVFLLESPFLLCFSVYLYLLRAVLGHQGRLGIILEFQKRKVFFATEGSGGTIEASHA